MLSRPVEKFRLSGVFSSPGRPAAEQEKEDVGIPCEDKKGWLKHLVK